LFYRLSISICEESDDDNSDSDSEYEPEIASVADEMFGEVESEEESEESDTDPPVAPKNVLKRVYTMEQAAQDVVGQTTCHQHQEEMFQQPEFRRIFYVKLRKGA